MASIDPSPPIPTTENVDEECYAPEPAAEGNIQMEYSSDWLFSPNVAAVTKNYL
jgi:hypothetical protein